MSNFRRFISLSAVAMLGVTNLLTPLSYANAATAWSELTSSDLGLNPMTFEMPDHDVYFYAHTAANSYTVVYSGHGETSGTMSGSKFSYDTSGNLARNEFNKTGYTFTGWLDDDGNAYTDEQQVKNLTSVDNAEVPMYAQWGANRYNIVYALNDSGTSQAVHSPAPASGVYDQTVTIGIPTRTGYSFSGWHITNMDTEEHTIGTETTNSGEADYVIETSYENLRADTGNTVYFGARWTPKDVLYTVEHYKQTLTGSYDVEPIVATGTATADQPYTGETTTYDGFTTPDEISQIIDANGTTVYQYYYVRDSFDLTLTAGRGIDSVTVSAPHSSGGTTSGTATYSIKYGDTPTLTYVVGDGYTGAAWSGGAVPIGTMPATPQEREAYAVPIEYTITVDTNGGTGTYPTGYNIETTPDINFNDPHGTNSDFLGWIGTDIDGTTGYVIIPTGSTGDRTYTAQWKCHTGYHASNSLDTSEINYGDCMANTETPFTIEYYEQTLTGGYVLTNTGSDHGTTDQPTAVSPAAREGFTAQDVEQQNINGEGDTVVQVYYNRNTYEGTVTPDVTGIESATAAGDNSTSASALKYEDTVRLNAVVETGYTFAGWTVTAASGDNPTVTNAGSATEAYFTMPASDVTITPSVTVNPYTIEYELYGGDEPSTPNKTGYTVQSATFSLGDPSRDNSVFLGWTGGVIEGEQLSGTTKPVTIQQGSVGNRKYYAVWDCEAGYHASGSNSCVKNHYTVEIDYNDEGDPNGTGSVPFTYDEGQNIPTPQQSGYDFAGWTVTGLSGGNATVDGTGISNGDVTSGHVFENLTTEDNGTVYLVANWTPRDDTEYTVYYYTALLSGGYESAGSDTFTGTTSGTITLEDKAKTISGFVYSGGYLTGGETRPTGEPTITTVIDKHGNTKIYLYYDRDEYDVTLSGDAHVTGTRGQGTYKYGATVEIEAYVATGYHFVRWDKTNSSWNPLSGSGS